MTLRSEYVLMPVATHGSGLVEYCFSWCFWKCARMESRTLAIASTCRYGPWSQLPTLMLNFLSAAWLLLCRSTYSAVCCSCVFFLLVFAMFFFFGVGYKTTCYTPRFQVNENRFPPKKVNKIGRQASRHVTAWLLPLASRRRHSCASYCRF